METFVVRVWVPDRPGALGQVASRIGSVGGDVVGIDILERGAGKAIDELVVTLPEASLVPLLVNEIAQVDDAVVEEIHHLEGSMHEPGTAALEVVAAALEAPPIERIPRVCGLLAELYTADWVCAVQTEQRTAVVTVGVGTPEAAWLLAFVEGSRHLPPESQLVSARTDLVWAELEGHQLVIAVGRERPALRARERRQLALIARVLDSAASG